MSKFSIFVFYCFTVGALSTPRAAEFWISLSRVRTDLSISNDRGLPSFGSKKAGRCQIKDPDSPGVDKLPFNS